MYISKRRSILKHMEKRILQNKNIVPEAGLGIYAYGVYLNLLVDSTTVESIHDEVGMKHISISYYKFSAGIYSLASFVI